MNIIFRLIIALGIPFALYLMLASGSEWLWEQPNAPSIFLVFWLILWVQPLWVKSRTIDDDTFGNLLSVVTPFMALAGAGVGLGGSVICAMGHPYAEITGSTVFLGIAVMWGVVCLALPGVLGGFSKPLANAGLVHDTRQGIMTSHVPPVTSMPLSDAADTPSEDDE
jgi:hypothetical protein